MMLSLILGSVFIGVVGVVFWLADASVLVGLGVLSLSTVAGILTHNLVRQLVEGVPVAASEQRAWWQTPEAFLPLVSFLVAWLAGWLPFQVFLNILPYRLSILTIIFALSAVALGLHRSGFFRWFAYRLLHWRMETGTKWPPLLLLFLGSSFLVCMSSNDAVVVGMIPAVLVLSRQAGWRNPSALLLTQFFAANTLSMVTFIGSPTNIIFAEILGLNAIDYMSLMWFPGLLALMGSVFAMRVLYRGADAEYASQSVGLNVVSYQFPIEARIWIIFALLLLVCIMVASVISLPYVLVTAPIIAFAVFKLGKTGELKRLPFSIIPFALVFFAFASELSSHMPADKLLGVFTDGGPWHIAASTLVTVSLVLNVMNDLPTAALFAEIASQASDIATPEGRLFFQATLAALNLGCCLTPVGALAGLIWLHQIRQFASDDFASLPTGGDLIRHGIRYFLIVASVLILGLGGAAWLRL